MHGPRFPVTTIRDNVQAVHQLLTQELGIQHLRAVIGFSMGAQQAFQWAVSYPGDRGPHCSDFGDGQNLWAWHRSAGGARLRR